MLLWTAVRPSPDRARSWVDQELTRAEYHRQSLLERFLSWLRDRFSELTHVAGSASPLSTLVALVLGLGLAVLLVYVASRVRRNAAPPRVSPVPVLDDRGLTAAELRVSAEAALREGRRETALTDGYRALVLRAVESGTIEASVGSTAHELSDRLRPRFPQHADRLREAADLFDAVVYGARPARQDDAEAVLRLDDELARTRPAPESPLLSGVR